MRNKYAIWTYLGSPQEYYLLHWSELLGGKNECAKISEECAVRLLRSLEVMPDTLAGMEFVNILHHLPAYFIGRRIEQREIRGGEERDGVLRRKERSFDVVFVIEDIEDYKVRDTRRTHESSSNDACGKYIEYFRRGPDVEWW